MIRTVAELLLRLKEEEIKRLEAVNIKHGPTIGDMFEGLSKEILSQAVPQHLGLQVVSGFITDGTGGQSGQIDCMLVRGEGQRLPYIKEYIWHVRDVIAVFEIKKTLYSSDLADAFEHLANVRALESNYIRSRDSEAGRVDVRSAQKAFAETTGVVAPPFSEIKSRLTLRHQLILHALVMEQVCAVRVIFGYRGFARERNFRRSLAEYLGSNTGVRGFGPGSFPQLIVSGGYSLLKANGQPFSTRLQDGKWPFCVSSSTNPLQLLLELIWTRLHREFGMGDPWGEDLSIENFSAFLLADAVESDGRTGWVYEIVDASEEHLAAQETSVEWEPARLSHEQFVVIQALCNGWVVETDNYEFLTFLSQAGIDPESFINGLLETGLVGTSGRELQLITEECQCVMLPDGQAVAAENNTGRLSRWVARHLDAGRRTVGGS
ncbi:DUF6602 domain-containing protein [Micromonospora sp. CB01531]|uniref:DUF6602 domain-containing protein n=1 Tax=Micromonospora sp. CB01531 TaxID=1718947 RepID=UPI000A9180B4|nr:DUF6602 domain-containing protein [Micromonospora sp. CB01531]